MLVNSGQTCYSRGRVQLIIFIEGRQLWLQFYRPEMGTLGLDDASFLFPSSFTIDQWELESQNIWKDTPAPHLFMVLSQRLEKLSLLLLPLLFELQLPEVLAGNSGILELTFPSSAYSAGVSPIKLNRTQFHMTA